VEDALPAIVSASGDRTLRLWHGDTGELLDVLEGHVGQVAGVVALPLASWKGCIASASSDCTVRVWALTVSSESSKICQRCLHTLEGHSGGVMAVCAVGFKGQLASASSDCTVRLWSSISGECMRCLEGHNAGVLGICALPDGRVASASLDRTVRVWSLAAGTCEAVIEGFSCEVVAVCPMVFDVF
jgi:WD40 repeat protein